MREKKFLKQNKIELLKEQKNALINQYVTKGIDENIEMKDSGVDWIGEIPKHWEIKKGKYILKTLREDYDDPVYLRKAALRFLLRTIFINKGKPQKIP